MADTYHIASTQTTVATYLNSDATISSSSMNEFGVNSTISGKVNVSLNHLAPTVEAVAAFPAGTTTGDGGGQTQEPITGKQIWY
jgi:hypothetical protein